MIQEIQTDVELPYANENRPYTYKCKTSEIGYSCHNRHIVAPVSKQRHFPCFNKLQLSVQ